MLPTPLRREIGSTSCAAITLLSAAGSRCPVVSCSEMPISEPELDFRTVTPSAFTSAGRRGSDAETAFCVCTAAVSRSVPALKYNVTLAEPLELDDDVKYSRLSMPERFCSITCVTVLCTTCALAPG